MREQVEDALGVRRRDAASRIDDTNGDITDSRLDEDGDELDTLIVTDEPLPTGVWLEARIVGIMNFEDDGEMDHKVIAVPADDRTTGDRLKTLDDLGERWKQKVTFHFEHYKDLKKPGTTKVTGWGDVEAAKAMIKECIARYKK